MGAALLSQSTVEQRMKHANREEKIWRRTRIAKPSKNEE
jgi:hypothetical protein